ncbi:HEXXH motif domain-containing protein [Actinomadura scrupuli]|uniref:HEXXH motif domain-containing protein n=1 Tax=Actinomadura scrupuli TaxID=559629 RepID=UPI003D9557B6
MGDSVGEPGRLVVPQSVFDSLAEGHPSALTGRFLAGTARDVSLLLLKAVAEESGTGPGAWGFDVLTKLHSASPARVDRVLRYPAVGAWARETLRALRRGEPGRPGLMLTVAAAAALRAGLDFEATVEPADGLVMLPSVGQAALDGTSCGISVSQGRAELSGRGSRVRVPAAPHDDGAGWQGLRPVAAAADGLHLRLMIDDLDPYRFPIAVAPRLAAADVRCWRSLLQEAWRLLCRHHRPLATELRATISVLTPLNAGAAGPVSGTSQTTFGSVALAPPHDPLLLAETLAHEVQHAKLAALLQLVDLVRPERGERYYAPWRPDHRPIGGLLHGAYAHLGVAAFWRRQRFHEEDDFAHAEFVRWRNAADEAAEVIEDSGALTPLGRRFVQGMRRTLRSFHRDRVSAAAVAHAHRAADVHRARYG